MKTLLALGLTALLVAMTTTTGSAQDKDKERTIDIQLKVPSTAYKVQILEVYQTDKELLVLSKVEGKGIGATVISNAKDSVKVKAPADLPVKHVVLGKTWNWGDEKYEFAKDREEFDKLVKKGMGMKVYERPQPPPQPPVPGGAASVHIIMYKKDIFTDGKTKNGETLKQLSERHAKEFQGSVLSILQIIDGCSMQISPENAAKLAKQPEVKLVEKDQPIGPN